jgi:3-hydroxy acid dehydrogenase/malonic semialdehyde reductase
MYQLLDPTKFVVFITGATSGFGAAAARRYVAAGGKVVATGRRTERLEALRDELGAENCHIMTLDVRDRAQLEAAIAAIPAPFDAINIVLANAGLALGLKPAAEASLDDWQTMIDTNISGLVATVRLLLPGLIARGGGHVVTLGSVAGEFAYPGGSVYAASKAFVKHFALAIRSDLQGKNVRVTDIEPGLTETEFSLVRFGGDSERAGKVYEDTKAMNAEDIAEAIFWATSLPAHVNVNKIQLMATTQAIGAFDIYRG